MRKWVDIHLHHQEDGFNGENLASTPTASRGSMSDSITGPDLELLVGGRSLYPINALRNTAITGARAEWVLTVELDLALSPDAHTRLAATAAAAVSAGYETRRYAYVIPLMQEASASCAGQSAGQLIKAAAELPYPLPAEPTKTTSGDPMSFSGCAYDSHAFMDYEKWVAAQPSPAETKNPTTGILESMTRLRRLGDSRRMQFEPYFLVHRDQVSNFTPFSPPISPQLTPI